MTEYVVGPDDTAAAMGSGDVPVLATPRLLAWLEAETIRVAAGRLKEGQTTVGTAVRLRHLRACPVGATIRVTANRVDSPGRHLTFQVTATDRRGVVLADGEVDRAVVDRDRFLRGR